jgi:hypothetical protein
VLWWAAVALLAVRVLVRRDWRGASFRSPGNVAWDAVVVVAVVLAALAANAEHGAARFTGARAVRLVCSATSPPLCLSADYESRLKSYAEPAGALSRAIGRLDPSAAPARLVQDGRTVAGARAVDGTVVIAIGEQGAVDSVNLALELVESASGCPRANTEPSRRLFQDEDRLAIWLLADAHLSNQGFGTEVVPLQSLAEARSVLAGLRYEC